ncbi:effector-associated constant component EACC1 [Nocardia sp. CA-128927]|uniref:effector-associated constant component EACC1 n=1 Tax=Nocardia sp. CA-128927 TaxID=3239975 RepID=UPI003D987494
MSSRTLDVLTVAIGSGGAFSVLAASFNAWLRSRPRTKITITRGGVTVELDSKDLGDAETIAELVTRAMSEPSIEPRTAGDHQSPEGRR